MENRNKQVVLITIDALGQEILNEYKHEMPNLIELSKNGVFAKSVSTVFPTLTWPLHTSIITGVKPNKHGIVSNHVYNKKTGERQSAYGDEHFSYTDIQAQTVYDVLSKNGYTVGSVCYPLTKEAPTIQYNIPEFYNQSLYEQHCGNTVLWNQLSEKLPLERYGEWAKDFELGDKKDWISNEIAKYLLIEKQVDFLMLHYLWTDRIFHLHGIQSEKAKIAISYIDQLLGDLINELKQNNQFDNTTFIVMSDHGQENIKGNIFFLVPYLEKLGLTHERQKHIAQGGCYYLYDDISNISNIQRVLEQVPEIETTYASEMYTRIGMPLPEENVHMGELTIQMKLGEMILSGKEGGLTHLKMADLTKYIGKEYKGMHGYSHEAKSMKPFCLFAGPEIKANILNEISLLDIAPTIAKLFNVQLNDAEGRALDEIID